MIISSINNDTKKIINEKKPIIIVFASHINDYIIEDFFPDYVEKIIFGYKSNISNYDYNLNLMTCGEEIFKDDGSFSKFNSKSINNFGSNTNIKWIIFPQDSTFNQDILTLPSNLEFLSLGWNYTKSLSNFPITLKYFILATQSYNHDIDKIPSEIEYFGLKTSNDMILNKVPNMTKYINLDTFRYGKSIAIYDNKVLDLLPEGIQVLKLNCSYNSELKNLPVCLKKLFISNLCTLDTLRNLPMTLELLDITFSSKIHNNDNSNVYFSNLPNSLQSLSIDVNFSSNSKIKPIINLDNLPESLSKLFIYTYLFEGIFDNLPNCLKEFGTEVYQTDKIFNKLFNNLPRNLKNFKISIPKNYNYIDQNTNIFISNIPHSLKKILISKYINFDSEKDYTNTIYDEHYNQIEFVISD